MEASLLLKRIIERDEQSFSTLVNIYSQSCYRVAWRQLFDVQMAEDIVQEVFLTVWNKPESWNPDMGCRFHTWLYRVVINRCIDYRRKVNRRGPEYSYEEMTELTEDETYFGDQSYEPEKVGLLDEKQANLKQAISKLDVRSRTALNLFYYEQMSQKEVAEIMGTTPKAVESIVARARKTLKVVCNEDLIKYGHQ